MQRRGVHKEVLAYCEVEILRRSIFHAVFETKPAQFLADRCGSSS